MNVCSPEVWSRYQINKKLAMLMNKDQALVNEINLYDIPEMRGRPLNTSMICSRLEKEVETEFFPLEDAIAEVSRYYS